MLEMVGILAQVILRQNVARLTNNHPTSLMPIYTGPFLCTTIFPLIGPKRAIMNQSRNDVMLTR